jgi:hypothetical protein
MIKVIIATKAKEAKDIVLETVKRFQISIFET